ncbi:MAG: hypothetical protein ACREJP_07090 [Candidatus Methylomirabilales bacterium]
MVEQWDKIAALFVSRCRELLRHGTPATLDAAGVTAFVATELPRRGVEARAVVAPLLRRCGGRGRGAQHWA